MASMIRPGQLDIASMEYDSLYEPSPATSVPPLPPQPIATPTRIDYSKFKTKLCRNFMMGIPCPFEHRCAFAHSIEEQAQGRSMASPTTPNPPSYKAFVQCASFESLSDSASSSRPNTPPAYPSRFRYDPYSKTGIIFAQ